MKKLFFCFLSLFHVSSFAQSYMIFDNGSVATFDQNGYVYDLGNYVYPQKITLKGGLFFVEENRILNTVDENGILFKKFEVIPEKILGKGFNYFLSEEGDLFTIDNTGKVLILNKEELKSASYFGGNYFFLPSLVEEELQLYTINSAGECLAANLNPIKSSIIAEVGGSYFMTNKGELFTLGKSNQVHLNSKFRVGIIEKKGGNFFVDSSGKLFTISINGEIYLPDLPIGLKTQMINKIGANYFIDVNARLFVVSSDGSVIEKEIEDQDLRYLRHVSY